MKIWILDSDVDNYENVITNGTPDLDFLSSFDGRRKEAEWDILSVARMYGNRDMSNTPGFSPHILIVDEKAYDALKDVLKNDAEFLPVELEGKRLYILNVIKVLDCIDYDKSEYKTFRDGKRIMRFKKYAFIESAIVGNEIFKIKDEPLKRPFVTTKFKDIVENSNLTGFKFELVWNSDE